MRSHRRQPARLPCPWDSPGKNTGVGCHFLLQCMKVKSERSHSVVSDSSRPHGLQPTRLLHPWDFPGKSTGVGCHCLLRCTCYMKIDSSLCNLGTIPIEIDLPLNFSPFHLIKVELSLIFLCYWGTTYNHISTQISRVHLHPCYLPMDTPVYSPHRWHWRTFQHPRMFLPRQYHLYYYYY